MNRYFSISPVCYTVLYPKLVEVAREQGYALAVHGSMVRDFDLIAVPWSDTACDALTLVLAIKGVVRGIFSHEDFDDLVPDGNPSVKPHGRRAWSIHFTNAGCHGPYIDISVMPRTIGRLGDHKRHGRREPYTAAGITRLPCFRCGEPSVHQWQVCADKRLFRPLCLACDIALNRLVLEWAGDPDVDAKMKEYEAREMTPEHKH